MRTLLLTLATVAAASALHAGAAQAESYPFCLVNSPGPGDCKYVSYGQCLAATSGVGGYCQPNYALPPSAGAPLDGHPRRGYRSSPPGY